MKIKSSEQGDLPKNPNLEGIPDDVKSVEAYDEIERDLKLMMVSDHTHRKVERFATCKKCSAKRQKRLDYLKKKGFKDYGTYLEWRKIMDIIKRGKDFEIS